MTSITTTRQIAPIQPKRQRARRVAVIEHVAPRGSGSPLHVHHNEDEWFYVIEGELTFWAGGQVILAGAGSFVYGPREIPHTFTVSSDTARFLLITEPAGFASFTRAFWPATRLVIGPTETEPPDIEAMARLAAEYGIEILGPPPRSTPIPSNPTHR
jgi:quercetin dioxygenase-like cupin family protein